ncbi:Peptidase M16, middle/third domain,Peptidase M16, C-terminal,Metalloenzyme, LuxS/M16 peptidase-like [Cinara cedri]|uniref:Peptidase M16, middle/third domain,Peptidase M16, C-terminal,Metalloenzyme, LuxS/M16 peptidase-like n=1 Tax=Cinara cedri TaxID=506608 RepID=A0A5E4LY59_9HEMI|nr:Peptidase M16, middle/third domain,Peptidase M16, C-terminal,Metalloenzyme, LuxS/M16 peptidase-like [Cinara cedri]
MLNFHSKWYSSHLMYLTVLGKEDLNTLEELVVSLFGNIKEKNVDKPYWPDPIYKEKQLATKTIVVPVSYIRGLYVSFLIPDQTKFYESKPGAYLSALFEHKGRSSISTVLKERGWSTDFAAGMKSLARGIELFDIDVDLTEEGIDHVDDIIKLIFQFVNMLKREGPQKLYYEENKNISTMHFQFKDQISPLEYIKNLTSTLVYYSLEDVLTANYIIREWKPDLIENLLSYFRPENMKLTVVSKDFQNKINMVDRFYGTRYSISKIPMETLNDWNKDDLCKDLKMPLSNLFITTDFSLVPIDENDPDHPYIFHESPILRIWLKTDTEFRFPKGFVSVDFFSPKVSTDPLYCNIIALFVKLFNEYFSDYAYDATRAGLYLTLEPSTHGFKITINGFTQKMHILINTIIEKLLTFKINSLQFNIFKEEKIKQLKSAIMDQPCNTAILYSSIILSEVGWTTNELLASIYDVNIENIEEFIEEFFSHMFMESLIYGNIDKTKALEIIQILEKPFLARNDFRTLIPQQMLRKRAVQLEDGESILYETISACHSNSCVQIQFQCGVQSTINSVIVLLFSNIMQKTCGNILGTQEQSRYVVFGSSQVHFGVLSLYITVQSAHTPMYVHTKIESYIDTIQELLTNMTNEEFEKYKDALTAQLLEKPKNIMEQASAYQIEISTQTYSFNQMQMFVEALKSVTKSDIVQFYVDKISQSGPKRHKLAVHVKSTLKNTNNDKLSQSDNSLRANNNLNCVLNSHAKCLDLVFSKDAKIYLKKSVTVAV